jgi:hypothetical protein
MKKSLIPLFVTVVVLFSTDLFACAVCFGDPNSPMTHGAKLAVFFMLGVVGVVLTSIVGIAIFWTHRARLVDVQTILQNEAEGK